MALPPRPAQPNAPKPPVRQPTRQGAETQSSPSHEPPPLHREQQQHPVLEPSVALNLFYNGHRIAKDGDSQDQWISMGRLGDGTAVHQMPVTDEIIDEIKAGQYYLVEDQGSYTAPPVAPAAPPAPPTVVDIPYVSANGAIANSTMGNWTGEPTAYAYAWQRDGTPIAGATSANYTMVAADKGHQIGCIVTASNAAGADAAPLSNTVLGP